MSIAFTDGPMGSIELKLICAKHCARSINVLEFHLAEVDHDLERSGDLLASEIDVGNSTVLDQHGDRVSMCFDLTA